LISPQNDLQLSVIIPSYRSGATLGQVLAAMSAQLAGLSYEIIVVDSASDGQAALLASAFPVVRVIEIPERLSCGAARNRGRQAAQGRLVLFVDADCVPAPDWGQHLRAAVARDPDILSGTIANGTPGSWSGSIQYWVEFSRFTPGGLHQERPFTPSFHLLLRRELLETLPPYPEDFLLAEDLVFDSYLKRAASRPGSTPNWWWPTRTGNPSAPSGGTSSASVSAAAGCVPSTRASRAPSSGAPPSSPRCSSPTPGWESPVACSPAGNLRS